MYWHADWVWLAWVQVWYCVGKRPWCLQSGCLSMMTSSNGNIFCVTGPLWGEFIGDRWIPLTKTSDTELWCFLWCRWFETLSGSLWRHCNVNMEAKLTLQWRHNERYGALNHRQLACLFNSLFMLTWKNISGPPLLSIVREIHRWPMDSLHKGPVARKALPCFEAIINTYVYNHDATRQTDQRSLRRWNM